MPVFQIHLLFVVQCTLNADQLIYLYVLVTTVIQLHKYLWKCKIKSETTVESDLYLIKADVYQVHLASTLV